ncbi:MAG: tRNA pseudouridine(13) synthase TruD [Pseudomonadales bacterium]|nr:tRNA pseudouridine(13) synthase TruD [Pseudomonadales bacterium]
MSPEDFFVEEIPGFAFTGEGEHACVFIEKTNLNTMDVVQALARYAGVEPHAIGYCGLKDKNAQTRQWFSVCLQASRVDFSSFSLEGAHVLETALHTRKLRRGDHRGNFFRICLRDVVGEKSVIEERLFLMGYRGVPNYFGEQRFGREGNNLVEAERLFARRRGKMRAFKQRMYVSAARAWLFNQILAERVRQGNWNILLEGEQVEPQAPLWGRGRPGCAGPLFELENSVLQQWSSWCEWLEHCGLQQERRQTVLQPQQFSWAWQSQDLLLSFSLSGGQFATSILRELLVERP